MMKPHRDNAQDYDVQEPTLAMTRSPTLVPSSQCHGFLASRAEPAGTGEAEAVKAVMHPKRERISILVACKRTVTCELYSQALNRHSGFHVATTATTVAEALEQLDGNVINVALISTTLGEDHTSALSLLQQIRNRHPEVKSVLLFDYDEADLVVQAFRSGAKGLFCVGEDAFKNLCRCVQKVHAGQVWANSAQLTLLLETFSRLPLSREVSVNGLRLLTRREEEIVRLVEEGLTNREIANHLGLSEHTVRNNLIRIFDKLGVSTRVELALYAVFHAKMPSVAEPEASEQNGCEFRDMSPQPVGAN